MKKIVFSSLLALGATFVSANETKFLPIATDDNYCLTPSVALVGGYGKYNNVDGDALYGVELDIACPLLALPSNKIKQQISLVYQDKNGLTTTSLELNPHVMFDLSNKVQLGVGPGLGVIFANADKSDTAFEIGAGASLNYDVTPKMFIGLEARYMFTTEVKLATNYKDNLNNSRTLLKVGMHF